MSSSSLVLLLACLSCAVLSATSCCGCDKKKPEKPVPCCPNGWTQFEDRCFMFHHTKKDWVSAEKHCQTLGGNLASITKAKEHFFVRGIIKRVTGYHNRAWIGGHDTVKEGVWMWSDGTKYSYTNWAKNEPNNLKQEHCKQMNWRGYKWNDVKCSSIVSFVCSKNL